MEIITAIRMQPPTKLFKSINSLTANRRRSKDESRSSMDDIVMQAEVDGPAWTTAICLTHLGARQGEWNSIAVATHQFRSWLALRKHFCPNVWLFLISTARSRQGHGQSLVD